MVAYYALFIAFKVPNYQAFALRILLGVGILLIDDLIELRF